ncbi:putative Transmembrane protein [Paratrimastix pyriformis]|uniref:Transmembrane protein n=1 Tax=Paratrimastix pyriformis TaxID=342808 RepID=A0ABQ8UUA0_9EUKA|nr:putative Transmembrane protein [Paratrimastix pyriformis]
MPEKQKTYGLLVGAAFVINFNIGVGILAIPRAFALGGLGFSLIFLCGITLICALTAVWVLESLARTPQFEGFDVAVLDQPHESPPPDRPINETEVGHTELRYKPLWELSDLCGYFIHPWACLIYQFFFAFFELTVLWSYCTIFPTSVVSYIPFPGISDGKCDPDHDWSWGCQYSYWIVLAVFALLAIVLSLRNLTEQKILQVSLTIFRFLSIGCMVTTSLVAIFTSPYDAQQGWGGPPATPPPGPGPYTAQTAFFSAAGLPAIFSACIFCQLFHHGIPMFATDLRDRTKVAPPGPAPPQPTSYGALGVCDGDVAAGWGQAMRMFALATVTTMCLYALMGTVCSLYFGSQAPSAINVIWGRYSPAGATFNVAVTILRSFVVLFPAIDVLSAVPLGALVLSNVLAGLFPKAIRKWRPLASERGYRIFCRLTAIVPPLALAAAVHSIPTIVSLSGTVGFFIGFVVPACLAWRSKLSARRQNGGIDKPTPYTKLAWLSSPPFFLIVASFGFAMFVFQIVLLCVPNLFS